MYKMLVQVLNDQVKEAEKYANNRNTRKR
jgi:hypothetical protein